MKYTAKMPVIDTDRRRSIAWIRSVWSGLMVVVAISAGVVLLPEIVERTEWTPAQWSEATKDAGQLAYLVAIAVAAVCILWVFVGEAKAAVGQLRVILRKGLPDNINSGFGYNEGGSELQQLLDEKQLVHGRMLERQNKMKRKRNEWQVPIFWSVLYLVLPKAERLPREYDSVQLRVASRRRVVLLGLVLAVILVDFGAVIESEAVTSAPAWVGSTLTAFNDAGVPWIYLVALAFAWVIDLVILFMAPSELVSCSPKTKKHRVRQAGDPVGYFMEVEDALESLEFGNHENTIYGRQRPDIGRSKSGETDQFEAMLVVESPPTAERSRLPLPAILYAVVGLLYSAGGAVCLLFLPSLVKSLPLASLIMLAPAVLFVALPIGSGFIVTSELFARSYRLSSYLFRVTMEGTFGSHVEEIPGADGRTEHVSRRYSDVRTKVDGANIITEFFDDGGDTPSRTLISAPPSEEFDGVFEGVVSRIVQSRVGTAPRIEETKPTPGLSPASDPDPDVYEEHADT